MKEKRKKKKEKPLDFINICTSALRRRFSTGPIVKKIRAKATLLDKKGIRGGKMVECFYCGSAIPSYKSEVEHIECVVPVFSAAKFMDIKRIFQRIFLPDMEPVVSCKKCHEMKTSEERKMRVWWRRQKRFMVYETRCKINNKLYIGVHGFKKLDDGYLGSGLALKAAVTKYGKSNFERRILEVFHLEKQAYKYEKFMVADEIVKDPMYYNIIEGGKHGSLSKEQCRLMSEKMKGRYDGEDNPNFGNKHSEETRKRIGNRDYPIGSEHSRSRSVTCVETKKVFKCMSDTKINSGHLSRAINNGSCAGGYHWYYTEDVCPKDIKPCKKVRIMVRCIETEEDFPTLAAAGRSLGQRDGSKIGEVLKGDRKTAGGYHWERLN